MLHATQPTVEARVLHNQVLQTELQKATNVAPTEYLAHKNTASQGQEPTIGSQVLHKQVLHTTKTSISFR